MPYSSFNFTSDILKPKTQNDVFNKKNGRQNREGLIDLQSIGQSQSICKPSQQPAVVDETPADETEEVNLAVFKTVARRLNDCVCKPLHQSAGVICFIQ